jgi:sialate O-acetylesterase
MILHRDRYEQDIATADYPQIRQFWIPTSANLSGPEKDLPTGFWKTANQQDVLQFSVVAFFFARKLYNRYHVPIGLINASVGGPPTQAWISEDGLKEFPVMFNTLTLNKNATYVDSMIKNNIPDQPVPVSNDKGLTSIVPWFDIKYSPKGWRRINVPGYWEDQGVSDFDGVIWYRKEINIPSSMIGLPSKIVLGRIVDADIVYLNGKPVGQTTYQYPQRRYWLPAGALVAGKNVLVVRVTNNSGKGGFVPDKPYYIVAGRDSIDIKGDWEYKVGQVFLPLPSNRKTAFSAQNNPSALYNAMVAPLTNYTISGFLWYQGESNTENPKEYGALMHALIGDWRKKWGQGNIPFLFVQLPNFSDVRYIPEESQWAATRQVQLNTMSIPNTGMAVTIDLGEWNDIHPDRKKEIGERLALWAEKLKYADTSVVVSGPLYQSSGIEGNKIRVRFSSTGSGLINRDGEELSDFEIAGSDRKFVWAKAKIVGDDVIVWNDSVSSPLYVRYAWADNPDDPNLYNKNGLPASPFESKIE